MNRMLSIEADSHFPSKTLNEVSTDKNVSLINNKNKNNKIVKKNNLIDLYLWQMRDSFDRIINWIELIDENERNEKIIVKNGRYICTLKSYRTWLVKWTKIHSSFMKEEKRRG